MGRQVAIGFPVEVAVVTLLIFVGKLQQSFAVDVLMRDVIHFVDFWFRMAHICSRVQARFGARQGLKEIRPESALVDFIQLIEARTEAAYIARHLR